MKNNLSFNRVSTLLSALLLSACASHMIESKPGSINVSLVNASAVSNCKSMGKVSVSVMAEFGVYTRSVDDVEANLLQLARNDAVESGADTLVKEEMQEYGKRTFALYQCAR